jgi:hypothetical protein
MLECTDSQFLPAAIAEKMAAQGRPRSAAGAADALKQIVNDLLDREEHVMARTAGSTTSAAPADSRADREAGSFTSALADGRSRNRSSRAGAAADRGAEALEPS